MAEQKKKTGNIRVHGVIGTGAGAWKSRQIAKKARGSQTPGKSKGIKASPLQRYMCRKNRSWKHPLYAVVMASLGQRKKV